MTPLTNQELADMKKRQEECKDEWVQTPAVRRCVQDDLPRCLEEIERLRSSIHAERRNAAEEALRQLSSLTVRQSFEDDCRIVLNAMFPPEK